MVSRTGQEKVMRRDTYKREELKKKRKNWFYKREEALLLTTPAYSPKYTAMSYLRHLIHRRPVEVSPSCFWEAPLVSTMELFGFDLQSLYFGETVLVQFYWTPEECQSGEHSR